LVREGVKAGVNVKADEEVEEQEEEEEEKYEEKEEFLEEWRGREVEKRGRTIGCMRRETECGGLVSAQGEC
jgi:cytosine/adenosine deaminase-related metal-dependent hydrolase